MKTQPEQSTSVEPTIADANSQLDVQFKDGKLIHMSILNQPIRSEFNPFNINFSNGELQLAAENTSLIEEIKILIRKLWN